MFFLQLKLITSQLLHKSISFPNHDAAHRSAQVDGPTPFVHNTPLNSLANVQKEVGKKKKSVHIRWCNLRMMIPAKVHSGIDFSLRR